MQKLTSALFLLFLLTCSSLPLLSVEPACLTSPFPTSKHKKQLHSFKLSPPKKDSPKKTHPLSNDDIFYFILSKARHQLTTKWEIKNFSVHQFFVIQDKALNKTRYLYLHKDNLIEISFLDNGTLNTSFFNMSMSIGYHSPQKNSHFKVLNRDNTVLILWGQDFMFLNRNEYSPLALDSYLKKRDWHDKNYFTIIKIAPQLREILSTRVLFNSQPMVISFENFKQGHFYRLENNSDFIIFKYGALQLYIKPSNHQSVIPDSSTWGALDSQTFHSHPDFRPQLHPLSGGQLSLWMARGFQPKITETNLKAPQAIVLFKQLLKNYIEGKATIPPSAQSKPLQKILNQPQEALEKLQQNERAFLRLLVESELDLLNLLSTTWKTGKDQFNRTHHLALFGSTTLTWFYDGNQFKWSYYSPFIYNNYSGFNSQLNQETVLQVKYGENDHLLLFPNGLVKYFSTAPDEKTPYEQLSKKDASQPEHLSESFLSLAHNHTPRLIQLLIKHKAIFFQDLISADILKGTLTSHDDREAYLVILNKQKTFYFLNETHTKKAHWGEVTTLHPGFNNHQVTFNFEDENVVMISHPQQVWNLKYKIEGEQEVLTDWLEYIQSQGTHLQKDFVHLFKTEIEQLHKDKMIFAQDLIDSTLWEVHNFFQKERSQDQAYLLLTPRKEFFYFYKSPSGETVAQPFLKAPLGTTLFDKNGPLRFSVKNKAGFISNGRRVQVVNTVGKMLDAQEQAENAERTRSPIQ